jgi:hypothetical protein
MSMSLWLVPREGNPFTKAVQELISDEVPKQFDQGKQTVGPHVTLTSDVDTGGKSPQEWLDNITFPDFKAEHNEVVLELDTVEADDDFYRKMNISVKDNDNLKKLAKACNVSTDFHPCLTLLFADLPTRDVANKIALIEMKIGFAIGDIFACCGGTLCMGGHLVLVDTSKPMDQWKAVAKRETPWVMWRATRNLL